MMAGVAKLVCIVDDEAPMRRALARLMRTHGYDTLAFASGRECLDGHEVDQAEVVIIDVSMPGMDGFELHTLLRASGRNIPTIFISAHANRQYASRAISVGAITFLNKPCDEAVLLRAIESVTQT
jgi:FixJ family two-component response regulator